jgi:hypothetical protein
LTLIGKNRRVRLFLTSAHMPTCPIDRERWHVVKILGKSRYQFFKVLK